MIDFLRYIYKPESALEAQTRLYWESEAHFGSNVVRLDMLQRVYVQSLTFENRLEDMRRRVTDWEHPYIADFPRFKLATPKTLEEGLDLLEHPQRDRELASYAQHLNCLRVLRRVCDLLDNNHALLKTLVDSYDERMLSAAKIHATIRSLYPAIDRQTTIHNNVRFELPYRVLYGYAPIACYVNKATNWTGRSWGRLVPCDPFSEKSYWDANRARLYLYFQPVIGPYLAAYFEQDNRLYLIHLIG